jgi:glucose/arabinose dehydrogenase
MSKSKLKIVITVISVLVIGIMVVSWANFSFTTLNTMFKPQAKSVNPDVKDKYLNYCAGCHGENLERFSKREWMTAGNDQVAFKSIKFGKENEGMPAFEKTFTDEEIMALAKYIRQEVPKDYKKLKPAFQSDKVIQSKKQNFMIDTVVDGLDIPWGMVFLPDGDMLIAERSGILYRLHDGNLTEMEGLPDILPKGQGGLLDLRLHPNYEENGWFYFAYSDPSDDNRKKANTSIMRARIDGNKLIDQEKIFDGQPDTRKAFHWGCKLQFDKEGYLFFGIGDRGSRDEFPQKLDNHNGKIHRIYDDGRIPEDNPFVDTDKAMPSIYSYGHRNPQGTTMHPETGDIWVTEHGPRGGDELNLIRRGVNYGWPVISFGINYNGTKFTDITEKEGMEQPVLQWTPSIAPCGTTFVTSDRYPGWKNNILVGSLRFKYLERVELKNKKVVDQEKLLEGIGRVRNVEMGPDGFIYVAMEKPGFIIKLMPVND